MQSLNIIINNMICYLWTMADGFDYPVISLLGNVSTTCIIIIIIIIDYMKNKRSKYENAYKMYFL